ncbi:MAG: hypothetical protein V7631_1423 [Massilia sp.]
MIAIAVLQSGSLRAGSAGPAVEMARRRLRAPTPWWQAGRAQNSWTVGRSTISLMSTSAGWVMAKATARATASAGIAIW